MTSEVAVMRRRSAATCIRRDTCLFQYSSSPWCCSRPRCGADSDATGPREQTIRRDERRSHAPTKRRRYRGKLHCVYVLAAAIIGTPGGTGINQQGDHASLWAIIDTPCAQPRTSSDESLLPPRDAERRPRRTSSRSSPGTTAISRSCARTAPIPKRVRGAKA